ncbi:MAG: trehalose-6-phosphate synthase [Silvanigrellales bacterium]|nr:trehalose-6-phosphate synthase [Silvanigrellales bacterium]
MFRLGLKFLLPLVVLLALLAYALVPLTESLTLSWFHRDLDVRARTIGNTLQDSLSPLLLENSPSSLEKAGALLDKVTKDERLLAVAVCEGDFELKIRSALFPPEITCRYAGEPQGVANETGRTLELPGGDVRLTTVGNLFLVHDTSFIARRQRDAKTYVFLLFVAIGVVVSVVTMVVARWSLLGWVKSVRMLLSGAKGHVPLSFAMASQNREFLPIMKDLKSLVRDLEARRASAEEGIQHWTPKTLKNLLSEEFAEDEVIVVSNREPYIHKRNASGGIDVQFPASGLVTAVEPIVRACSGVWVAHGSGSADRDVVDARDRIAVPPGKPQYEIHRVWLTAEEELGYYYGFSNEGLWPLCHIAHTRPIFRTSDWETYRQVNEKFAHAVVKDAKTEDPVILVQDYHFALLPRLLRELLPNATIITFWHIPWPNAESFGICPWRNEIMEGLLGSSIVGFHTQLHCNNFLETVDRFLESRIDKENASISFQGHVTAIKPYPISIEWPPRWQAEAPSLFECRRKVFARHGFPEGHRVGIGVDRLDYTKGIIERLLSVERLFELHPQWLGKFTFVQIAAPSRSQLPSYRNFDAEVRETARRINEKFTGLQPEGSPPPLLLLVEHHEPQQVLEYYRASEVGFVTSLHDGMNLVAKEYVAARDDDTGVLILSMFAGASREMSEALIINPYNIDECGEALHHALTMPLLEQKERMRSMRSLVREFNVYRWAARMLMDAATVRRRNRLLKKTGTWNQNAKSFFSERATTPR